MTCIIDIGGGNRGVYGAGVFERCLIDGISFDCCLGVSAGSANVITYLANQPGRLYRFYHNYAFRKEYMGFANLLKNAEYINLDYIYAVLSNSTGEDPLNLGSVTEYKGTAEFIATDAGTGKAVFIDKSSAEQDNYWFLKASCSLPVICKPVRHDGRLYFDGGISNPVPIDRALELGCDKIVLILTKPKEYRKEPGADVRVAKLIKKQYPEISKLLYQRAEKYNAAVKKAIELEKEGKCLIIAPDDCCGVGTLKKTPDAIKDLYFKAYADAGKINEFI